MGLVVRFRTHLLFIPRVALTALALGSAGCAPKFNFNSSIGLQQSSPAPSCAQTSATAVGSGTSGDPYQITCPAQIVDLASNSADWAADYQLESDIDMSGVTISQPIGNDTTNFTGVFDGNGYTISNFTLNDSTDTDVGLFGYVDGNGTTTGIIENLTLSNANVAGHASAAEVGGLVGQEFSGTISDCSVSGAVTQDMGNGGAGGILGNGVFGVAITGSIADVSVSGFNAGGLVGYNVGPITDCYALGSVSGVEEVGGLAGSEAGDITNSFARGNVTVSNSDGGGLVGWLEEGTTQNSYATGAVSGSGASNVGGLAGFMNNTFLVQSYSTGAVSGASDVGGLIGQSFSGNAYIGNSYWNDQVNSTLKGIGNTSNADVIGASSTVMQSQSSGAYSGWDFSTPGGTWEMPTGGVNQGYPVLQWSGDQ